MVTTNGTEFKKIVKHKNFMTPEVKGYYLSNGHIVELSTDIYGEMWGVTVVKNGEHDHDLSQSFSSRKDAENYIEAL